jgi:hypothetical protein
MSSELRVDSVGDKVPTESVAERLNFSVWPETGRPAEKKGGPFDHVTDRYKKGGPHPVLRASPSLAPFAVTTEKREGAQETPDMAITEGKPEDWKDTIVADILNAGFEQIDELAGFPGKIIFVDDPRAEHVEPKPWQNPLPTEDKARKELQIFTYLTEYFPDATLAEVGVAVAGNRQHNPGEPLHWARGKSMNQLDTAFRHLWDHKMGVAKDIDGQYHLAKAIWRLKAELQLLIEKDRREGK